MNEIEKRRAHITARIMFLERLWNHICDMPVGSSGEAECYLSADGMKVWVSANEMVRILIWLKTQLDNELDRLAYDGYKETPPSGTVID